MLPRYTPLPRSRLPLRRTPLRQRSKPKPPSLLHPNKRYPLSPRKWQVLRLNVFQRSRGMCEAWKGNYMCLAPITYGNFQPHHIRHRSKGGQDTMENVIAVCPDCHRRLHGDLQWTRKSA